VEEGCPKTRPVYIEAMARPPHDGKVKVRVYMSTGALWFSSTGYDFGFCVQHNMDKKNRQGRKQRPFLLIWNFGLLLQTVEC
jgi:hypothetical protein